MLQKRLTTTTVILFIGYMMNHPDYTYDEIISLDQNKLNKMYKPRWMASLIVIIIILSGIYLAICPQSYLHSSARNLVEAPGFAFGEDSTFDEGDYEVYEPRYYKGNEDEIILGFASPKKIKGIFLFNIKNDTKMPKKLSVMIDNKHYCEVESEYNNYCNISFMNYPVGKTIKIKNLDSDGSLDIGKDQIWIKTPTLRDSIMDFASDIADLIC